MAALEAHTGVRGKVRHIPGQRPDAYITLKENAQPVKYWADVRTRLDRLNTLAAIRARIDEDAEQQHLLVTDYLTNKLAEECRKLGLQFIDTAGNAYIRAPGLHIQIQGNRKPIHPGHEIATPMAGTATALRITFALLCNRNLLNEPYRKIIDAAGVALGTVGGVLRDLQIRGHLIGPKGRMRFAAVDELIDEWTANYPVKLRRKLHPRRFDVDRPHDLMRFDVERIGAFWGGELAADQLTRNIKPTDFTLYIDRNRRDAGLAKLVQEARLHADPNGRLEVLDKFWNFETKPRGFVPPLLAYADLLATHEPRNLEVAREIRRRYLENQDA